MSCTVQFYFGFSSLQDILMALQDVLRPIEQNCNAVNTSSAKKAKSRNSKFYKYVFYSKVCIKSNKYIGIYGMQLCIDGPHEKNAHCDVFLLMRR